MKIAVLITTNNLVIQNTFSNVVPLIMWSKACIVKDDVYRLRIGFNFVRKTWKEVWLSASFSLAGLFWLWSSIASEEPSFLSAPSLDLVSLSNSFSACRILRCWDGSRTIANLKIQRKVKNIPQYLILLHTTKSEWWAWIQPSSQGVNNEYTKRRHTYWGDLIKCRTPIFRNVMKKFMELWEISYYCWQTPSTNSKWMSCSNMQYCGCGWW